MCFFLRSIPFIYAVWLTTATKLPSQIAKPSCQAACGNVIVPYPFGIGPDCSITKNYSLSCNASSTPPKLIWRDYQVLNISLGGELSLDMNVSYNCHDTGRKDLDNWLFYGLYSLTDDDSFAVSSTRNIFTAVGCDTFGYFQGEDRSGGFISGACASYCFEGTSFRDSSCDGGGCCQTTIPRGVKSIQMRVRPFRNYSSFSDSLCSYSFLVDADRFSFTTADVQGTSFWDKQHSYPLVLDWAIGGANSTCLALANETCASGECYNSGTGLGYRCRCLAGYDGNPYLPLGCTDIDECKTGKHNCADAAYCNNLPGTFECKCPKGHTGDGLRGGRGCASSSTSPPIGKIATARLSQNFLLANTATCFLVLLIGLSWSFWAYKNRKLMKLRRRFFDQNGGSLLRQLSSSSPSGVETIRIFTAEELQKATNNFHASKIVGRGGYGTVYTGTLSDNRIVAIKKALIVDGSQIDQFINEIVILHRMNHRNVVQLLGCCLETAAPLLVYEFISNGTLSHHIHDNASPLSLEHRLRIAAETAGALAFLHSAASVPIIHRDVKSANILLDSNFTAKVSDFGASKLVPLHKAQVTTLVQGTLGYLDPEYFQTGQLSEKSDVYSFGVVLVELLTGEMPICSNRSQDERNLSMYFLSALKGNRLFQVLEDRVVNEGDIDQLVTVAELARRCLKVMGEDRPTMKEVAAELERLRAIQQHPWIQKTQDETRALLSDEMSQSFEGVSSELQHHNCRLKSSLMIQMERTT